MQVLHGMQLRALTPREPILDVKTKSKEEKLDPDVISIYNDLYAGACEIGFGTLSFDKDEEKQSPLDPR